MVRTITGLTCFFHLEFIFSQHCQSARGDRFCAVTFLHFGRNERSTPLLQDLWNRFNLNMEPIKIGLNYKLLWLLFFLIRIPIIVQCCVFDLVLIYALIDTHLSANTTQWKHFFLFISYARWYRPRLCSAVSESNWVYFSRLTCYLTRTKITCSGQLLMNTISPCMTY